MTQPTHFTVVSKAATARRLTRLRVMFVALAILTPAAILPVDTLAQARTKSGDATRTARKTFKLRVAKDYLTLISLKADKSRFTEIATDLSRRLGTKVILGPGLSQTRITVEFYDMPLETALKLMAPHVYIDYEIKANAQPTPLAIFLQDQDEPAPAKTAVVQGSSDAMMIEGNTEDVAESPEASDEPLQVDLENNNLTIKSKKQLLVAVILTIAEVMEIPAEIKYDSTEIIDTVIKDTPFEDAITRLSPDIRLYVRADLTRSERTPLRLKLLPPAKAPDSAGTQ